MSVLDQINKLEEQKKALIKQAHDQALQKAQQAVEELNSLGYKYTLAGGDAPKKTRTRRAGIRPAVLAEIKKYKDGISRQDLLKALGATDDEKKTQSISNAVVALKKADEITGEQGIYRAK